VHNEDLYNLYYSLIWDWMGRACSIHGGDEKGIQNFRRKTSKEEVSWGT
jgi:hypothetical protein